MADDRDDKGRFLPGNSTKRPNWPKGTSGHPARYRTLAPLKKRIEAYFEHQDTKDKPYSKSGIARALELTTSGLDRYYNGEVQTAHPGIVGYLEQSMMRLEEQREEWIVDKARFTPGLALAMKNHHDWRDDKRLHVEHSGEQQQVLMVLPPDLARVLAERRGETIEGIEGIDTTYRIIEGEVT